MAVSKNFVVKNGLEVNTDLIIADSTINKVGIGSTIPSEKLDVSGTIIADNVIVSGISTISEAIFVGTGSTILATNQIGVGFGTAYPQYPLDVRTSVSTGKTALNVYGDVYLSGKINQISISGTSFFNGISYFNDDVYIQGKYYGEGSALSGIVTTIIAGNGVTISPSNGKGTVEIEVNPFDFVTNLGISSGSSYVGSGVTTIDFQNASVSPVVGGIATVSIPPSATIGLAIALS